MARIASVFDARVAAGSNGTRRTTDLPVTLSITQTSTESGERSPTMATTASAPRRAASCSRPARESPARRAAGAVDDLGLEARRGQLALQPHQRLDHDRRRVRRAAR